MSDTLGIKGILRIYEFSCDEEQQELAKWWKLFDVRMKEHNAKLVLEVENMLMSAGRTQILTFIGASGTTSAFAQKYAVGTGIIYDVKASDPGLASELFRATPASFSVVGNTVTISTPFSTSQANGTYTNSGIFGVNATGTAGSGTLMTHLLYSYVKTSSIAITNDYDINAI